MKDQKILIADRKAIADENRKALYKQAEAIELLIQSYNSIAPLENLTTPEQCFQFLASPKTYFESHVISDTGISFNSRVTPSVQGTCTLFAIDYNSIIDRVSKTNLRNIERFEISTELHCFPTPQALQEAEDSGKIFITDLVEIAEYQAVNKLCEDINTYCERYNVHSSNLNQIAANTGLRCENEGKKWFLKPEISVIRNILKHGKNVSLLY